MPASVMEYVIAIVVGYNFINLLTPLSFKVRLVNIKLEQEGKLEILNHFMDSSWRF